MSTSETTYDNADAILHTSLDIQHRLEDQDKEIEKILGEIARLQHAEMTDPLFDRESPVGESRRRERAIATRRSGLVREASSAPRPPPGRRIP